MELKDVIAAAERRSLAVDAVRAENETHSTWFQTEARSTYDAYYGRPNQSLPAEPELVEAVAQIEARVASHTMKRDDLLAAARVAHVAALVALGDLAGTEAVEAINASPGVPVQDLIADALKNADELRRQHIDGGQIRFLHDIGPFTTAFVKKLVASRGDRPTKANVALMIDNLRDPGFVMIAGGPTP